MNHSGRAVQAAMAFYKLKPEQLIVIYDELDLPVGKLRIKRGGGANGHNGIKDIDAAIGQDYWRIRLG
ncbi:aminoacyl-tRNA hydrolase, partial [Klebsiella pneumoniae]|uniref:aminoacyl-tRNA hydrolase n=1 Tax=Klebsiella pneumoniae TaxID=573 RepID=UPI003BC8C816